VYWPGQPEPTRGARNHREESIAFFKSFDNHLDNRPYKTLFGRGDWTCSIARRTGPMAGPDGSTIPATGKSFELDFCTVAR
jgi:hypothetical protein